QQRTVTGTVISSEDALVMPGVNVMIKGAHTGTTTDHEGKYAILVSGADPTLVFSFIGYVSQEIKVKDKSVVNVAMHIDAQLLSEVVVTGYAEMKKHDVTGAVHGVSVRGKARKFSSAPVQQNRTEYEY